VIFALSLLLAVREPCDIGEVAAAALALATGA
jgi:hypothetical protein